MNSFSECPRCGDHAFERLETYGHCVGCLYVQDSHFDSETSYREACEVERLLDEGKEEPTEWNEPLAS